MDGQSDESLIERIQKGNAAAFEILVRRHNERFYALAFRYVANKAEAEDVAQDAFLKLWQDPSRFDGSRGVKFTTWFYRVVSNLALDRIRSRKKMVVADYLDQLPDTGGNQGRDLIAREQQAHLELAIASLPDKQALALNLCFYEGLSNKEAAEIIGVGVKAVESLLMRAKKGLKDYLIKEGILEDKDGQQKQA